MNYKRGTTTVVERGYSYDALGRPLTRCTARQGSVVNDAFLYNTRSELTQATVKGGNYDYAYDNIGNRKTAQELEQELTYESNSINQYASISEGGLHVVSAASLQRRLGIASIEALKELFKAKGGKKGYWFWVATGSTLPAKKGKKDCPSKIQGSAVGQNEESTAKLSKKNAKDQVPRDCCPKHLQPYCTKM